MSITVVGSIAYDAVKTPFGERSRMLGGAAVHFALAAAFFDQVHVVGPVGGDFSEQDIELLRARSIDVSDIERIPDGQTFFWRGEYGWDLNARETIETRLGVFEGFHPKLSERSRAVGVLFLANIQPDLQREVRGQLPDARFVALDSMNLWIETARESLVEVIRAVDCLILNDSELRQLTAQPNLLSAAQEIFSWAGPSAIVAKQGEYGAALITPESFFALPAFPMETVVDPTGAGDTFAGGFVGYIAAHLAGAPVAHGEIPEHVLRAAMAHGTALASFNVQRFGTERILDLTRAEISERVGTLQAITSLPDVPVAHW
jgi:sugar/nucleoside kinase (ribokinase family)